MSSERNALAELAEAMATPVEIAPDNADGLIVLNREQLQAYQKAQRIVAELANADLAYANDPVTNNCVELRLDAFKKCRAIAEEGRRRRN